MTHLKILLAASSLCLFGAWSTVFGQANAYDIEIVVFLNETSRTSEVDHIDPDRNAEFDRILSQRFQRTGAVIARPAESGHMSDVVARLDSTPGITVLQHVTWRQEVASIDQAPFVDVSAPGLGEDSGMRGLVRFYHTPLLYVDVLVKHTPFGDPLYFNPSLPQSGMDNPGVQMSNPDFLDEKRRLRLKELHYLDHPRMGVIIGAWPIE